MPKPRVSMIAALGKNRLIGKENKLLWSIPEDLKRFRSLTRGHPVIMGRKTFDSIVSYIGKPLPERANIVVTRDPLWSYEGVSVAHTVSEAIIVAKELDQEEVFVIGGTQIYAQALPYADRLYLTLIDDEKEGDAYFPEYETTFIKKVFEERREHEGLKFTWVDLEK